MNSFGYGQQPAPYGWRRYTWIITLVVGIGLGALLVGSRGGPLPFMGGRDERGGIVQRSGPQRQVSAPDTTQQQPAPRQDDVRGDTVQQRRGNDSRGERHGGFFAFDLLELLVPLLLIGGGAWLIWGRRRGPWNRGFTEPTYPPAPFEPMTPPEHRPETGETRRL